MTASLRPSLTLTKFPPRIPKTCRVRDRPWLPIYWVCPVPACVTWAPQRLWSLLRSELSLGNPGRPGLLAIRHFGDVFLRERDPSRQTPGDFHAVVHLAGAGDPREFGTHRWTHGSEQLHDAVESGRATRIGPRPSPGS